MTKKEITTPPNGYSLVTNQKISTLWVYINEQIRGETFYFVFQYSFRLLIEEGFIKLDDEGNVVWDYLGRIHSGGGTLRPIPDSEHPEEGMTTSHTEFNETTRKWELPDISEELHTHHETESDNDVPNALDALCDIEAMEAVNKAFAALVSGEQRVTIRPLRHIITKCLDDKAFNAGKYGVEDAWLKSLGKVTYIGRNDEKIRELVSLAQEFGDKVMAILAEKRDANLLRQPVFKYVLGLIKELKADRTRTSSERFLPRQAKIVETLSTPADVTEITKTAFFNKWKTLVVPAPSSP